MAGRAWCGMDIGPAREIATGIGPVVVARLKARDRGASGPDALLAFFDFPAEHWAHLRTSSPIESVFATVRHRTVRTKGALSPRTAKLMVFKLVDAASKSWRRLKGTNHLPKVIAGVRFSDGIEVITPTESHAA